MNVPPDALLFSEERHAGAGGHPWKIMIVDDDEAVHSVTRMALNHRMFHGRPVAWLSAHSGAEAIRLMRDHSDVALVMMDVVMESDRAGLDAVQRIRGELRNDTVQIAVRTGQPSTDREENIVPRYGIDHYVSKTELTASRLFTLVHTSLAHYQHLRVLERRTEGFQRVLEGTTDVLPLQTVGAVAAGVVNHLARVLTDTAQPESGLVGLVVQRPSRGPAIVVGATAGLASHVGRPLDAVTDATARERLSKALTHGGEHDANSYCQGCRTQDGGEMAVYIASGTPLATDNIKFAALFCQAVAASLGARTLQQDEPPAASSPLH